jgi:hypothetical protein
MQLISAHTGITLQRGHRRTKDTEVRLLALAFSILSPINLFMENAGSVAFALVINAMFFAFLALFYGMGKRGLFLLAFFGYCVAFHEYGPDPYRVGFLSFFRFGKYVLLAIFFLGMVRMTLSLSAFFLIMIAAIATTMTLVSGEIGSTFPNDAVFIIVLVLFGCHSRGRNFEWHLVPRFLFYFTTYLPVCFFIEYILGLKEDMNGAMVFLWGHYFGFLVIFSVIYFIQVLTKKQKIKYSIPLACVLVVFMQSAQTAHYILLILSLTAMVIIDGRAKVWLSCAVAFIAFTCAIVYVHNFGDSSSRVYLKVNQLIASMSGDRSAENNSFGIRVAQLITIDESFSVTEKVVGRGLGATYHDVSGLFSYLDLHDMTFRPEELNSGEYSTVHEPIVKMYLMTGIIGSILLFWLVAREIRLIAKLRRPLDLVPFIAFYFLFAASLHTGIFLLLCCLAFRYGRDTELAA